MAAYGPLGLLMAAYVCLWLKIGIGFKCCQHIINQIQTKANALRTN